MRVIKVGGRAQADPLLVQEIAKSWRASPGGMCVVHGGGDEISGLQKKLGLTPTMNKGRRVTTAEDLLVVRMVLSGLANKRLVSALAKEGVSAVGISGEDGFLLRAEPRDAATLGMVGKTPLVKTDLIHALLRSENLPVISPVSACTDPDFSDSLNVNGDDAAGAIAVAMSADELLFVSDVSAVREASGASLSEIDIQGARQLIENGVADGGMAAKLESAVAALEAGVAIVRIGTLEMLGNPNVGTTLRIGTGVES